MANLLAKCTLEEARSYNSRLIRIREGVSKKGKPQRTKDKVYLNVVLDGSEEEGFSEVISNGVGIADVITVEDWENVPDNIHIPQSLSGGVLQVFVDYEDRNRALSTLPSAFRVISYLPESTKEYDVFELAEECISNPRLRFTGNTLINVEGLKAGRFDEGDLDSTLKSGLEISAHEKFDDVEEVVLSELEGIEEGSSPRTKKTSAGRTKKVKSDMDGIIDLDTVSKKPSKKPKTPSKADLRKKLLARRSQ